MVTPHMNKKQIKEIMKKVGLDKRLKKQSAYTAKEVTEFLVDGLQAVVNDVFADIEKKLKKRGEL